MPSVQRLILSSPEAVLVMQQYSLDQLCNGEGKAPEISAGENGSASSKVFILSRLVPL